MQRDASFDGCSSGWYSGRSIHIHLLVRPEANAGESTTKHAIAISQQLLPEALTQEIHDGVAGDVSGRAAGPEPARATALEKPPPGGMPPG